MEGRSRSRPAGEEECRQAATTSRRRQPLPLKRTKILLDLLSPFVPVASLLNTLSLSSPSAILKKWELVANIQQTKKLKLVNFWLGLSSPSTVLFLNSTFDCSLCHCILPSPSLFAATAGAASRLIQSFLSSSFHSFQLSTIALWLCAAKTLDVRGCAGRVNAIHPAHSGS